MPRPPSARHGRRRLTSAVFALVATSVASVLGPVSAVRADATVEVQIAGRGGVPADATAAVINMTATNVNAPGWAIAWPCGSPRPEASSLNYQPGVDIANSTIVTLDGNGRACVFTSGSTDLIVDATGAFPDDADYAPLVPSRLLDTRSSGAVRAGATVEVHVAGRGGVPADATAAVVNVTATNVNGPGWAIVWPCGTPRPEASSLNYVPGADVANSTIVKLDGNGRACVYSSGSTDLIVDVTGSFGGGDGYLPLVPARLLDTRSAVRVGAGSTIGVPVGGRGGVPHGASAAVLNVTATRAASAGWATVWPCGTPRPEASSLNYRPEVDVANSAIVKLGAAGEVCLYASSTTDLIVDVTGTFPGGSRFLPLVPARVLDTRSTSPAGGPPPARFATRPVGAALPSGEHCANWVRPVAENKPMNVAPNQVRGTSSNGRYGRVDGNFTGTTDEILQWVSCKWGIDEDLVRAQAVTESWWRQSTRGDLTHDQSACHPTLRTSSGPCPESVGIMQVRFVFHSEAFADLNAIRSTAYNADYAYAFWRACFEGEFGWLNNVARSGTYSAGDDRGCLGVWAAGRWYTNKAIDYLGVVEGHLATRKWEHADFQNV